MMDVLILKRDRFHDINKGLDALRKTKRKVSRYGKN